ncbi:MAG: hypothetical protein M3140_04135 [Actinomycetota bacterium]|nr:hypothetical protein [Actinomycetota bacterium]
MPDVAEMQSLHRALEHLRSAVGDVRRRYGDIPAVRRLAGDVERIELDLEDLRGITPVAAVAPEQIHYIDDQQPDPAMWVDVDDEGLGGYHGASR